MPPLPRKFIPAIAPYPPGKPIEEVEREYGLDSVIKLASNENPIGPSRKAMRAMCKAATEMHLYPDGACYYLKQALARKFAQPFESIIVGNGSDEITDMLAVAYLSPRDNIVISDHDFISYQLAAQMVGARFKKVPLKNWRCDLDGMLDAIDPNTRLVCIANPSNPVGTYVPKKALEAFLAKVPDHALVLVDEAYAEYVTERDYATMLPLRKRYSNLIVTRTFSKAYGLAGLRIGYGFADPEVIRNFDRVRPPFNVNRMAQIAALAALDDAAHLKRSVEANQAGRALLEKGFAKEGIEWIPSATNFILFNSVRNGPQVVESLLRQGVITRPMGGYGLPNHVRVTIGTPAENRRFLRALHHTLAEVEPLK